MAGSFADYLENKALDYIFSNTAFSPAATLYMGLSTTTIADAGTGITEPVGNAYARVAITNNAANFPAAVAGAKSNGADVNFPTPTGAWGTVTDFFLSDAASGGNIYTRGVLNVANPIVSGNIVKFPAGSLTYGLD